jgi:hypothetical protein
MRKARLANIVGVNATPTTADLLKTLDAESLRRQLDELDADRAAVLVLLRAARARQREREKNQRREAAE